MAEKLLKRAADMPKPIPPEDKSITTIYVGNVSEEIGEDDLNDYFYQFGEIRSINIVRKSNCAFIQYMTRSAAEEAVKKSFQRLIINKVKLTIRWGKSQGKRKDDEDDDKKPGSSNKIQKIASVPGLPIGTPDYFGLVPSTSAGTAKLNTIPPLNAPNVYYPSQDPNRMGSILLKQFKKD